MGIWKHSVSLCRTCLIGVEVRSHLVGVVMIADTEFFVTYSEADIESGPTAEAFIRL